MHPRWSHRLSGHVGWMDEGVLRRGWMHEGVLRRGARGAAVPALRHALEHVISAATCSRAAVCVTV
jgi:hypothetical protein